MPKVRKTRKTSTVASMVFGIEYAKTCRSICNVCDKYIMLNEVRTKKVLFDTKIGKAFRGQTVCYHLRCFAKERSQLGWFLCGDLIPGVNDLSTKDKWKVRRIIP